MLNPLLLKYSFNVEKLNFDDKFIIRRCQLNYFRFNEAVLAVSDEFLK